jgi:hypothetical protein
MKKKAKPRSSGLYSEAQLTGIRHSNTVHRLATIERLLQQRIGIEWNSNDPRGRNWLLELGDHDALFLTRTGKAYRQSTYYHHSICLYALAKRKFKKDEAMEFTSHDLRHLYSRRTVDKYARMRIAMPPLNQPSWSASDIFCNGVALRQSRPTSQRSTNGRP